MLAYSSIENMGIIAFGTGIGGLGAYGAIICLIHHSLIKSSLFLTSGNILLGFGSRLFRHLCVHHAQFFGALHANEGAADILELLSVDRCGAVNLHARNNFV